MSAREWKRGDVAMVTTGHGGPCVSIREGMDVWICRHGKSIDARVLEARPLVAIDPEDRDQVARLADAFCSARWSHTPDSYECDPLTRSSMKTALDAYLAPAPEEPTGLGAVVEDRWGHRFVLTAADEGRWWNVNEDQGCTWDHIDAVRLLSEGVTP